MHLKSLCFYKEGKTKCQAKVKFIKGSVFNRSMTTETVMVNKDAITDLVRVKDEFDSIVESLELMADPEFMASYKKARQQIEKREFVDWNEL